MTSSIVKGTASLCANYSTLSTLRAQDPPTQPWSGALIKRPKLQQIDCTVMQHRLPAATTPPAAAARAPSLLPRRPRRPCAVAAMPSPAALQECELEFSSPEGHRLVGTLLHPAQEAARKPTVLLAHGYMSSRHSELLVRLATALARQVGMADVVYPCGCASRLGAAR